MIQPLFSLRSAESFGIGDFTDLKKAVLWAKKTGLKLIQLLPIHDTIATRTWRDSYPYAAISVFALHPIYLDVRCLGPKKEKAPKILATYEKRRLALNALAAVDYEAVLALKWEILQQFFQLEKQAVFVTEAYQQFFTEHQSWLIPYSCFCCLRDQYKTVDFSRWDGNDRFDENTVKGLQQTEVTKQQLDFYYYLQFQLHQQLKDAADFAHQQGVVLKGDIAIGVYKNSVDVWKDPELFHRNEQAGAPPDDFTATGQNWGFPTYNWPAMEARNFDWWRNRLLHMAHYFDAIRIDHILGFFRIWSIPTTAVEGILGFFQPANPIHKSELQAVGVHFPLERLSKPYLHLNELKRIFVEQLDSIAAVYFDPLEEGLFQFKAAYDCQRKVQEHFDQLEKSTYNKWLLKALLALLTNKVLLEEEESAEQCNKSDSTLTPTRFHFRFNMEQTSSFQKLNNEVKKGLSRLYQDYFFQRQNQCWEQSAMDKLPALKSSTNMLICGEDLGFTPNSVPKVMDDLSMLRLFVQRMPKIFGQRAEDLSQVPYLSVVSPSTHDTSSIRGWWLGLSRQQAQIFYQQIMQQSGMAPAGADIPGWLNKMIVEMHLAAPAMWSIFLLQDLLNNEDKLHTSNPDQDQINHPENPNQYWNYRMPVTLEQLMENNPLNQSLLEMIRRHQR